MHIQKITIDSAISGLVINDLIVVISSEFGLLSLFTFEREKMSQYILKLCLIIYNIRINKQNLILLMGCF